MTNDEHRAEAERLLVAAAEPSLSSYAVGALVARAQAHATLALGCDRHGADSTTSAR